MPFTIPVPPAVGALLPRRRWRHPASGAAAWGQQRPNQQRPFAAQPRAAGSGAQGGRRSGRHPELLQLAAESSRQGPDGNGGSSEVAGVAASGATVVSEQPRPEEVDERYRRADYSDVFQFKARQAFARCIAGGEPQMRLAEAALHVTAEDDAIASHSTVRFPVDAWMGRIEALVEGICRIDVRRAATAAAGAAAPPPQRAAGAEDVAGAALAAEAAAVLRVAERYLFEEVGFRIPEYGRSNLPANCLVDHPGVWEDPRLGYLHEALIRRLGHPATLALLLGEVATRLLARGVLPCAAAIDTRSYALLPRAVPLPALTRERLRGSGTISGAGLVAPGGGDVGSMAGLNTCTSEVLVEMLRHLKRSYWAFPWDSGVDAAYPHAPGSHGGFRSAAKAAMGDDVSAALAAIGKVAAWRLERGIWTSPGAGDLRRARAASERLVLLAGDRYPEERRDLAVLLLHCGEVGAARLELRTYLRGASDAARCSASAQLASIAATDPRVGSWVGEDPPAPDPFDLLLCRRLMEALEGSLDLGLGVEEPGEALGLEATLRAVPPWERPAAPGGGSQRHLPLTW